MFKSAVNNVEYSFDFSHMKYESKNGQQRITTVRAFVGETPAVISSGAVKIPAVATSICHPEDNFVKSKGRKIALTRLLKFMKFSKEERTQVWSDYFKTHKKA